MPDGYIYSFVSAWAQQGWRGLTVTADFPGSSSHCVLLQGSIYITALLVPVSGSGPDTQTSFQRCR